MFYKPYNHVIVTQPPLYKPGFWILLFIGNYLSVRDSGPGSAFGMMLLRGDDR